MSLSINTPKPASATPFPSEAGASEVGLPEIPTELRSKIDFPEKANKEYGAAFLKYLESRARGMP